MKVVVGAGLALGLLLTACGGVQGNTEPAEEGEPLSSPASFTVTEDENTPTTIATTSSSSSTTTTIPKDPQEELNILAFFSQAVDQSKIVETDCGKFALLVLEDQVKFFRWLNNLWADNSDVLGPDGQWIPRYVKSVDLTGDSVLDLFVQYSDPDTSEPIGAVFMERDCVWEWAEFDNGEYVADYLDGLTWSEQKEDLTGSTVNYDGYEVPFTVSYSESNSYFEAEFLPFEPPPPACVSAFDLIKRKNYPEVLYSFFWYVYDRADGPTFIWGDWITNKTKGTPVSLRKCRKNDWITEANRRRSQYANHVDAQYYGERYVLLSNENALSILEELCTLKVWFGGTDEQYAYRQENSIACEGF